MLTVASALGVSQGFYPERDVAPEEGFDRSVEVALGRLRRAVHRGGRRFNDIVPEVERQAAAMGDLDRVDPMSIARALRGELRRTGFGRKATAKAFALVRAVAERRLGQRHFDVQLIGGWALLNGVVVEMMTGEGKTLTATLPACTAALAGVPVHVVTVNDYLTRRDAEWMRPVYESLGLSVGTITHDVSPDERRRAYRCDVTYCTNKELVFDYLRDRMALGRKPGPIRLRVERLYEDRKRSMGLRLRGLYYAIVDEADSVLIDEARTPLIISGPGDDSYEVELYRQSLELSERLVAEEDYKVDFPNRQIVLTDAGRLRLEELGHAAGGFWNARLRREDLVRKALSARHLFHRDKHYIVRDDKVLIVDEYTGRVMPGRSWEGGIHQLIEAKESCPVTTRTEVLARISYQRFFKRYLALAGMTGTASEAARELWSVYALQVVTVPPNRPAVRQGLPTRFHGTAEDKWRSVVDRVRELHRAGRPVLIGTRTVSDSMALSRLLVEASLAHDVLNALQDSDEATVIAAAGQPGKIVVATNMAGRGTDIRLDPEVRGHGGLHVIATELHDAQRIDRQLFGRCGRQGDPGTYEAFVSFEDELLRTHGSAVLARAARAQAVRDGWLGRRLGRFVFRQAQRRAERKHFQIRKDVMLSDEQMGRALSFSGRPE